MKTAELKFTRGTTGYWWLSRGRRSCGRAMRDFLRLWDVDDEAVSCFWVQAHTLPAADRVKASVTEEKTVFGEDYPAVEIRGIEDNFGCAWLDSKLKPLIGKSLYLELWYTEKRRKTR